MAKPDLTSPGVYSRLMEAMLRRRKEDRDADAAAFEIRKIGEIPVEKPLDPLFVMRVVREANAPPVLPPIPAVV